MLKIFPYNNTIGQSSSGNSGSGLIYISDITPLSGGNVGDKIYLPDSNNHIILSCSSDNPNIRVHIIAFIGKSNLRPTATVNGIAVGNWNYLAYETDNRVLFRGYADITLTENLITAVHQDGATATAICTSDEKPNILELHFINNYPGIQTELKENDHFDIYIKTDLKFIKVEIDDIDACQHQIENIIESSEATFPINIANRGNIAVLRPAKVRVQKASGTWSDWVYTNAGGGMIDKIDLVNCNNLHPSVETILQSSITYPTTQQAIKNSELVDIKSTCSNFDEITYSSPNNELIIPDINIYVEIKNDIQRINGDYNITQNNYNIYAHRIANDSSTEKSGIVYIANTEAILTISESQSRLRSGGNDGTISQNYPITISSNQNLLEAPTLDIGSSGIWLGSSFIGSNKTWIRNIQIHDNDIKGTFTWGAIQGINLAGIITTTNSGDNNYIIGGFVSRTITLQSQHNEVNMNVAAIDYNKVAMTWEMKALPNKRPNGTTNTPDANSWCLNSLNTNPTIIRILDTGATKASSTPTIITIEESI